MAVLGQSVTYILQNISTVIPFWQAVRKCSYQILWTLWSRAFHRLAWAAEAACLLACLSSFQCKHACASSIDQSNDSRRQDFHTSQFCSFSYRCICVCVCAHIESFKLSLPVYQLPVGVGSNRRQETKLISESLKRSWKEERIVDTGYPTRTFTVFISVA